MTDNLKRITDNPETGPVKRPVIDLQLFQDDPPAQPAAPAQGEPQGEPQGGDSLLSFFQKQMGQPQEPAPGEPQPGEPAAGQPQAGEPQPAAGEPGATIDPGTPPQFEVPEKFKGKTPEEIAKAYVELESVMRRQGDEKHQTQQQLQQTQQQLQQMQGYIQYMMGIQQQQTRQAQPQLSPEEIQKKNEEWLNRFYENPMEALNEVVQARVTQAIQPLQQQQQYRDNLDQYNRQVQEAKGKYPDFDTLLPEMENIIKEQGQYLANMPNAVDNVYHLAKARKLQGTATPDQMLQDPNIRQKILQDETIRNEILKSYAQGVRDRQPPVTIGSQPGEPPAAPSGEMKTSQDTRKAVTSYFSRFLGGGNK